MNTLLELYDERTIENVLGPETFKPRQIIYLCEPEIARDKAWQQNLHNFFAYRGLDCKVKFEECSLYKTDNIVKQLLQLSQCYPDCALDITGGTDAALFAAGVFCEKTHVPTFTYSRRKNRFFDISGAPFAENLPCTIEYSVEDFVRMAGGRIRQGRVDNIFLGFYLESFDDFFHVFLRHRKNWVSDITFIQRISQNAPEEEPGLSVAGDYVQKGERGGRITADEGFFKDLEEIGYIKDLNIKQGRSIAFTFTDKQIRTWLRDVGSVLELYMYKACLDAGIFLDVISSCIIDWDGITPGQNQNLVSNEVDVVATRGVVPLFISCKATDIKTEALNELSILADRFGGKGAKAAIVTTESCSAPTRHRAAQLGITVIDYEELAAGTVPDRLKVIMKVRK